MKRRQFLHSAVLAAGIPLIGLNRKVLGAERKMTHRRLVLVELAGANDGLNTLVPYTNDHYHILRPTIGLHQRDVLTLDDRLGMHSSLGPLMPLWERGELAWVQGLGYPLANRSHFKSMALWETAGDGQQMRGSSGWVTHAVEHRLAREVLDPHGISLAGNMSVFASKSGRWLSTRSVKDLMQVRPPVRSPGTSTHEALTVVQQRLQVLDKTLTRFAAKLDAANSRPQLPAFDGGAFGEQLRQVGMMIAAGIDTPVYRVRLNGFDTHKNQRPKHLRLMRQLSQSLVSFSEALRNLKEWENTLIMTYSEFGRRAAENHSAGTDHGTAAPHILAGGAVVGGLYGQSPDLSNLIDGDPIFTMDYRALYHRMLVDGLGADDGIESLGNFVDERLKGLVRAV